MVYLHFPSNLTEEELMLQAKYQKLKKKKKALQALKAPKQEPEKPILPKRPTEARDAREIARKLIKSGAIQAIKSPPPQPQNATFKRPRAGWFILILRKIQLNKKKKYSLIRKSIRKRIVENVPFYT